MGRKGTDEVEEGADVEGAVEEVDAVCELEDMVRSASSRGGFEFTSASSSSGRSATYTGCCGTPEASSSRE